MQQTIPFRMDATNPKVIRNLNASNVGRFRLRVAWASDIGDGIDGGQVVGWFGRELTKTQADAAFVSGGVAPADDSWEFQSVGGLWYEIPPGTAFVTVHTLATGRGLIVVEPVPDDGPVN